MFLQHVFLPKNTKKKITLLLFSANYSYKAALLEIERPENVQKLTLRVHCCFIT